MKSVVDARVRLVDSIVIRVEFAIRLIVRDADAATSEAGDTSLELIEIILKLIGSAQGGSTLKNRLVR